LGESTSKDLSNIRSEYYASGMTKFPRPPRRLERVYAHAPLYFITCCTYRRRALLANHPVHAAFLEFGQRGQKDLGVAVGRYVILPDHLHFFVAIPAHVILGSWVGTLKRFVGKAVKRNNPRDPIWQRGFFDHILRSAESYSKNWHYVRENPVRARLVESADAWPYAGEIAVIYHG
jgi:putative transposase